MAAKNNIIRELEEEKERLLSEKDKANNSFWRAAAFTGASVLAFTLSIISIDIGIEFLAGTSALETLAVVTAATSIAGAGFAQSASNKVDKFEEKIEETVGKITDLTTKVEIGMTKDQELAGQKAMMQKMQKERAGKHAEDIGKTKGKENNEQALRR